MHVTRQKDVPYPAAGPRVGDRVRSRRPMWGAVITGTVKKTRSGYDDIVDGERCTHSPWLIVEVDEVPPRWPYVGRTSYAPDVGDVVRLED